MAKIAFLFPGQGQGSIKVGMGQDAFKHSLAARRIFVQADTFFPGLTKLCFRGPEDELLKTINSQPASLVVNLALAAARSQLEEDGLEIEFLPQGVSPDYLAGHSVGYIAALVYSRTLSLRQGFEVVRERARLMRMACLDNPGKMVVLLNPRIPEIENLCCEFGVDIGNYNSETQIVLSGRVNLVDGLVSVIRQKKLAEREIPLKTEGAFHSRLMESAREPFREFLLPVAFADPRIPIVGNSKAKLISSGEGAKTELVEQLCQPVRWAQSMRLLEHESVTTFIEIGHGETLSNNLRRSSDGKRARIVALSKAIADHLRPKSKEQQSI